MQQNWKQGRGLRFAGIVLGLGLGACGGAAEPAPATVSGGETQVEMERVEEAVALSRVAQMEPTEGNAVRGTVTFIEENGAMRVRVSLAGFTPGTTHGFHVHEVGDCSAPDGTSAGGHFNPAGHDHALPGTAQRHVGDLGNVEADEAGAAEAEFAFAGLTIEGPQGIDGRGVIVHASPDDGGQPTGNAGARIACGVIR